MSKLMMQGLMEWTSLSVKARRGSSSFMFSAGKQSEQGIQHPPSDPSLWKKERQNVTAASLAMTSHNSVDIHCCCPASNVKYRYNLNKKIK